MAHQQTLDADGYPPGYTGQRPARDVNADWRAGFEAGYRAGREGGQQLYAYAPYTGARQACGCPPYSACGNVACPHRLKAVSGIAQALG